MKVEMIDLVFKEQIMENIHYVLSWECYGLILYVYFKVSSNHTYFLQLIEKKIK